MVRAAWCPWHYEKGLIDLMSFLSIEKKKIPTYAFFQDKKREKKNHPCVIRTQDLKGDKRSINHLLSYLLNDNCWYVLRISWVL